MRKTKRGALRFVVQMHSATRLHFDLRLEFDGVFKSWAVPKGPSLNPLDQRLAVFVEDHPLEYGSFEGIIPEGNYGAGTVMVWDQGTYLERSSLSRQESEAAMKKALAKGHITFVLDGQKLKGEFALIKLKKDENGKSWLLVKKRDEYASYKRQQAFAHVSVKSGRTMEQIREQSLKKGVVWLSKRESAQQKIGTRKSKNGQSLQARVGVKKKQKLSPSPRPDPMPRRNRPMLPIVSRNFQGNGNWLIEPHIGGLRAIAEVEGKRVHLYSKSGLPFEKKFPQVVTDLKDSQHTMVLDGEVTSGRGGAIYHIFDILYFAGRDLRKIPLQERKKILSGAIQKSAHVQVVAEIKSKTHSPGPLIAKNPDSLYCSGTSNEWLLIEGKIESRPKKPQRSEEPRLTHLDKIFWPEEQITKGDLLEYYRQIAPIILPYLENRPQSLNRQPNGIAAPGFYQKDMTGHIPRWLKTVRIFSESAEKSIDYVVCQDLRSLLYIVNLGCIEINPWFSKIDSLDRPDFLVIDLDPDGNEFSHVVEVAQGVHKVLDSVGAPNFCKTSGATGIHIGVPTGARYEYEEVRSFAESVCRVIAKKFPVTTSVERNPNRRRGKIYLDFMQNRRGQTLAAPYCVRPRPGTPVSMPLTWSELTERIRPEQFNIHNSLRRVEKHGDLWRGILGPPLDLASCVRTLKSSF